jgi:hypothetical protein
MKKYATFTPVMLHSYCWELKRHVGFGEGINSTFMFEEVVRLLEETA